MERRRFFQAVAAAAVGVVAGSKAEAKVTHIRLDVSESFNKAFDAKMDKLKAEFTARHKANLSPRCRTCSGPITSDLRCIKDTDNLRVCGIKGTSSDDEWVINVVAQNIQQRGVLFQQTRVGGA